MPPCPGKALIVGDFFDRQRRVSRFGARTLAGRCTATGNCDRTCPGCPCNPHSTCNRFAESRTIDRTSRRRFALHRCKTCSRSPRIHPQTGAAEIIELIEAVLGEAGAFGVVRAAGAQDARRVRLTRHRASQRPYSTGTPEPGPTCVSHQPSILQWVLAEQSASVVHACTQMFADAKTVFAEGRRASVVALTGLGALHVRGVVDRVEATCQGRRCAIGVRRTGIAEALGWRAASRHQHPRCWPTSPRFQTMSRAGTAAAVRRCAAATFRAAMGARSPVARLRAGVARFGPCHVSGRPSVTAATRK